MCANSATRVIGLSVREHRLSSGSVHDLSRFTITLAQHKIDVRLSKTVPFNSPDFARLAPALGGLDLRLARTALLTHSQLRAAWLQPSRQPTLQSHRPARPDWKAPAIPARRSRANKRCIGGNQAVVGSAISAVANSARGPCANSIYKLRAQMFLLEVSSEGRVQPKALWLNALYDNQLMQVSNIHLISNQIESFQYNQHQQSRTWTITTRNLCADKRGNRLRSRLADETGSLAIPDAPQAKIKRRS